MVLQQAVSATYALVQHSWEVSTFIAPVFLAGVGIYAFTQQMGSPREILDLIEGFSRDLLAVVVFLGGLAAFSGFEVPSLVITELAALGLLGVLFWTY